MDISVVTAVKARDVDEVRWLEECLASVHSLHLAVEHIVVDDGSETPLALLFRENWPNVRWLRNEESFGPGAARNMGIRAATGAYIFPLDGDDRLCTGALDKLWANRCDVGIVYGQLWGFSAEKPEPVLMRHDYNWKRESLVEMTGPIGINALYPRSMWAAVGGYRTDMAGLEDIEFLIRCAERGYCGAFFPVPMVEYRQHPTSRTSSIFGSGEVKVIRARIEEWHAPFFGGRSMACRKCPQGQAQIQIQITSVNAESEPAPDGFVNVKYIGPKQGSFRTPTSPNGNYYKIQGRGSWIKAYANDVDWLLSLRYGGQPEYQKQHSVVQPMTILPDTYTPAPIPDVAPVVDIAALKQTEAVALIMATNDTETLRVWMAMEKAREKQRGVVIGALKKQMDGAA